MIDIHIHGANGADTMDATPEALSIIAKALPREGTTSFLATTMTQSDQKIEKALINVAQYVEALQIGGTAEVIGIHLEGPFISKKRAGAQPVEFIQKPNINTFKKWQKCCNNLIKVVTLAPEEKHGTEFIRYLSEIGVIASIGHSDATYEDVIKAIDAGASQVTHVFNGMTGVHHRKPGVALAALVHDDLLVEIIVDGIHVNSAVVNHTYKSKTSDRILLITDSMRAKSLKGGHYDLGGQKVMVSKGKAVLENGALAGSVLEMGKALQNFKSFTGCNLEELVKMTSFNQAKRLNILDRKGSIKEGKDADFVLLDKDLEVLMTFCSGHLAYKRGESL
jgi:N-acetylglucosamine-6-phosphate deacetylase